MNSLRISLASIVALVVMPMHAVSADEFLLDDQHTSIVFATNHFGLSNTYGMFGKYAGKFIVDMANPETAKFQIVIDAASLDTKSEKRDEHLRGPDFFDVKQFPKITFLSTSVSLGKDEKSLKVTGNLTLHGETIEVTIPLTKTGEGKGPYGDERIGFAGRFVVKRSEFGMTNMVPQIGDDVTVLISIEGIKQ
ncbi:MAG TPA: YceI family protein [Planctomycetaceae bacterium]|jgi:polyisoprenoid-binding protein YceI|nr:YceI family protein [Planctomycetaceae bacterium]HQZ64111.1 YceI family protein [Planctomycetaceae bacterium]HRA87153.1 YceI family protein [Planctomycetaceae bacterium]